MKSLLKKYQSTCFAIALILAIAVYPLIVTLINPPPPKNALTLIHAKILEIKKDAPKMKVLFSSGATKELFFPNAMFTLARGDLNFLYIEAEQRKQLQGCNAQLYVKKIDWFFTNRLRVWEINCGKIVISYEQFARWYATSFKISAWLEPIALIGCLFIVLMSFIQDRKK